MKRTMLVVTIGMLITFNLRSGFAETAAWKNGGPEYLYPKVGEKPPNHDRSYPHDENLKCMDCHKYDGVDAYTAATMTLRKSKVGRMSRS